MFRSLMSIIVLAGLLLPAQLYAQQQKDSNSPPANSDSKTQKPSGSAQPQKPSNGEDNPFPEDISRKAEENKQGQGSTPAENAPKPQTDATPGESSSTSRFSDLDADGDDSNAGKGKKSGDDAMPVGGHDTKRALEDDQIGKFYLDKEDWKGAYNRFKDALAYEPEDAEAAFGLAQAASKMKLTEDAIANYRKYLELDPDGPHAKSSQKALKSLDDSGKEASRK